MTIKDKYDFGIFGSGVIGLSIAKKLLEKNFSVILLEKNNSYGFLSSSNNSGVIHSGAYYETNSLKHLLCIRGKELLYEYCKKKNIRYLNTGKLFISLNKDNNSLNKIYDLSLKNGLKDLNFINEKQIKNIDSKILSKEALFCPSSGIINKSMLLNSLYEDCKIHKNNFFFKPNFNSFDLEQKKNSYIISLDGNNIQFNFMINSTGLESPIFHKKNIDPKFDISHYPVFGAYLTLKKKIKLNTIVYTSLNPGTISERVDATPTFQDNIIFGPSIDYELPDQNLLINRFHKIINNYIKIDKENLKYSFHGIRPKAKNSKGPIKDYIFLKNNENNISLINIESPGLTSCLAIAEYVCKNI
tara:strand:- start:127 stop:1200 length:1074 start_codon:yes stop_codon:yes gene_type:complete